MIPADTLQGPPPPMNLVWFVLSGIYFQDNTQKTPIKWEGVYWVSEILGLRRNILSFKLVFRGWEGSALLPCILHITVSGALVQKATRICTAVSKGIPRQTKSSQLLNYKQLVSRDPTLGMLNGLIIHTDYIDPHGLPNLSFQNKTKHPQHIYSYWIWFNFKRVQFIQLS